MLHDRPSDRNESEVADWIARRLSERGMAVRRESAGGHEFILRQAGDESETELMWIACNHAVGESHVEQLKQSAASVGASGVCIVTTADGEFQTTTGPDVSHCTVDDLSVRVDTEGKPHDSTDEPGPPSDSAELSRWDGLTAEASGTHPGELWATVTADASEQHSPSRSPWDQSTPRTDR